MYTFLFSYFICLSMYAQVGGEFVYQFLNTSTSARQVALGGEVLTLLDDVNQPIWNPSSINIEMDNELSTNYASYLAGIKMGSVSFAKLISRRFGTIHSSIKYVDYGSLIGADEYGNEVGNFSASDIALSVGYAYNFPWTNFYIGSNLKFINTVINHFSSTGIALDFGLSYYSPYKPFSFTLVLRNMGKQLKSYTGTIERLPFKVAFGVDYRLEHVPLKWYFTLDNLQKWNISVPNPSNQTVDLEENVSVEKINFLENSLRHFIIGVELFPESIIHIRMGYNFRRASELKLQNTRTFGGISFGFGLKLNRYKFNYAYSKFHSATNAGTFSLQIDLDRK